ncbi:MAG: FecR domain-containing protein, partial [Rikenellaceae bacterium]|nr:FecR domain-containing protein [Rikenellaceae bacterium]
LLYRFFRCEATPAEENSVLDWIDLSAENSRRFEAERMRYYKLYLNAPGVIDARRTAHRKPASAGKTLLGYIAGIATITGLIILTGVLVRSHIMRDLEAMTTEIFVPAGQRMQLTLSDGTSVTLNSGTVLQYPVVFGKERRVKLKGEGMFDVVHDPGSPFIVETFVCDLEVIGTKFNVVAEETEQEFSASLFEGRLKLCNFLYGNIEYVMNPNESLSLNGKALMFDHLENNNALLLTEGLLSLENISFERLMRKFEKYYDVTIEIERETPPVIELSRGKIKVSEGIDHALKILQTSADFTYVKKDENRLIIIK